MGKRTAKILDIDGKIRENPDFPIAVVRDRGEESTEGKIVDPIFTFHVTRNLYGRMMTLIEATTDSDKLKAVKDVFSKELRAWENDVYQSARDIAEQNSNISSHNIYN